MKTCISAEARFDYNNRFEVSLDFIDAQFTSEDFIRAQELIQELQAIANKYITKLAETEPNKIPEKKS